MCHMSTTETDCMSLFSSDETNFNMPLSPAQTTEHTDPWLLLSSTLKWISFIKLQNKSKWHNCNYKGLWPYLKRSVRINTWNEDKISSACIKSVVLSHWTSISLENYNVWNVSYCKYAKLKIWFNQVLMKNSNYKLAIWFYNNTFIISYLTLASGMKTNMAFRWDMNS